MNINDLKNLEKIDEILEEISHVPFDEMFSEKEIYTRTKIHTINRYSGIIVVLVIFAFGIFGGKEVYNSYKMREIQARQTAGKIKMYANMSDLQKNAMKSIDIESSELSLDEKVSVSSYVNSSLEIEQKLKDKKITEVSMNDGSVRYISADYKDDLHSIDKLIKKVTEQPEKEACLYNVMAVNSEIKGDFLGAKNYYSSAMSKAPDDPLIINNVVGFATTIERNKNEITRINRKY